MVGEIGARRPGKSKHVSIKPLGEKLRLVLHDVLVRRISICKACAYIHISCFIISIFAFQQFADSDLVVGE